MKSTVSETVASDLAELSRKTGLVVRQTDSATLSSLFDELEKYDSRERGSTFNYLKHALNETRASLGTEPVYRMGRIPTLKRIEN